MTSRRQLIAKYNRPGPRYTSYPTALQFSDLIDKQSLIGDVQAASGPLSLYVHLPFCESLCWFCACTTVITRNRGQADRYLSAVETEMDLYRKHLDPARVVEQIHLGGGSPSFLEAGQLDRLGKAFHSRFHVAPGAECSAELDPRTLTRKKVDALARHGFTRASFGIQDLNPDVQKAVHRVQPDELNRQCLEWARQAGFQSVNIDLIYGLPLQTTASFGRTLDTVLDYRPDRLAVFAYAHVPWVAPGQKILEREHLPEPEERLEMLEMAIDKLTRNGYRYIGMDHFSRETDELTSALDQGKLQRNFQGYSTRAGHELCAFGMSAISQSRNAYRQNYKTLDTYYAQVEAGTIPIERGYWLTADDQLRRDLILQLMCSGALTFADFNRRYGIDFHNYFAEELTQLREMAADGLIALDSFGLELTELGRRLMRNVAMVFDAHLQQRERRHAHTI